MPSLTEITSQKRLHARLLKRALKSRTVRLKQAQHHCVAFATAVETTADQSIDTVTPDDETLIAECVPDQREAFMLVEESAAEVIAAKADLPPIALQPALRKFFTALGRVVLADTVATTQADYKQKCLEEWSQRLAEQSQQLEDLLANRNKIQNEMEKIRQAQEMQREKNRIARLFERLKDQHDEVRRLRETLIEETELLDQQSVERSVHLDEEAIESLEIATEELSNQLEINNKENNKQNSGSSLGDSASSPTISKALSRARRRSTLGFANSNAISKGGEEESLEAGLMNALSEKSLARALAEEWATHDTEESGEQEKFKLALKLFWEKISAKVAIENSASDKDANLTEYLQDFSQLLPPEILNDSQISKCLAARLPAPAHPTPAEQPPIRQATPPRVAPASRRERRQRARQQRG